MGRPRTTAVGGREDGSDGGRGGGRGGGEGGGGRGCSRGCWVSVTGGQGTQSSARHSRRLAEIRLNQAWHRRRESRETREREQADGSGAGDEKGPRRLKHAALEAPNEKEAMTRANGIVGTLARSQSIRRRYSCTLHMLARQVPIAFPTLLRIASCCSPISPVHPSRPH
jgi:hypothetical protein